MDKAPDAFRTISEVAGEINVPQHVLRFWESRFAQIRPMKRGGGRRYYRPDDVDLLRGVRHLLYGEGYTIRGVQRILREEGIAFVQNVWRPGSEQPPPETEEESFVDEVADDVTPKRHEPSFSGLLPEISRDADTRDVAPLNEPIPGAPASAPRAGITADSRRKLQAALEDLVVCRAIVEAALSQEYPQETPQGHLRE